MTGKVEFDTTSSHAPAMKFCTTGDPLDGRSPFIEPTGESDLSVIAMCSTPSNFIKRKGRRDYTEMGAKKKHSI
jgi:hypothetical protein